MYFFWKNHNYKNKYFNTMKNLRNKKLVSYFRLGKHRLGSLYSVLNIHRGELYCNISITGENRVSL